MMSERYHRQIILKGFGEEGQKHLSAAKVLVIGAGGLGCPALQYLAAAGVGHLGIIDNDTISLSNLHRQILYTVDEIGQLKARVAATKLGAMNPEIAISVYTHRLERNNILSLLKQYDYVVDGTDNFDSRYLINDACQLLDKPLIFAAVSSFEGQLAIFNAGPRDSQTNYRDLFPISPKVGEIPNCAEGGVLGALPGILGTMAAAEVIKLICGLGNPLINQLLHYDLLSQTQYVIELSPAKGYEMPETESTFLNVIDDLLSCDVISEYTEIDAAKLNEIQQEGSSLFIDVRESYEFPALDDSIFRNVPMSEFDTFINSTIEADSIVLICQHGIRSISAAEALYEKYGSSKKLYSLKGGIARWGNQLNGII